jgi:hypothetical protein
MGRFLWVVSIWFNTWQYSQFEMASYLSVSLLSNFLEKIGAEEESKNLLQMMAKGAAALAKTGAVIGAEMVAGGEIAGRLNAKLSAISNGEERNVAQILEELKDKITIAVNAKLKKENKKRIVVFVDDLDRLAPEKAVELLEVLKIFMDVPNCVFVLAVDYQVITQGLVKKFGDQIGHSKGKSFFDKIIQLPFAVPTSQYNIKGYIQELLKNVVPNCSNDEISLYQDVVNSSIGCNPRSLKRIFNSFILLNKVADKKGIFNNNEIKKQDKQRVLFATLCLQLAFPELYDFMIKKKNNLDAVFFQSMYDLESLEKENDKEKLEIEFIKTIKNEKSLKNQDDRNLYYSRVSSFIEFFCSSLQLDKDSNLSDEELENLKSILSFSAITANTREEVLTLNERSQFSLEIGNFSDDELERKLKETFASNSPLIPRLIVVFKTLLSEDRFFDREELKQKLFQNGIGKDVGHAGRYLSGVSKFFTSKNNPHLRQVIEFDFATTEGLAGGKKDNYRVVSKYKPMLEQVFSELEKVNQSLKNQP